MMARSNSSNQRPDTLMQDHNRHFDETLLRRTAGPYSRVTLDNGFAPFRGLQRLAITGNLPPPEQP